MVPVIAVLRFDWTILPVNTCTASNTFYTKWRKCLVSFWPEDLLAILKYFELIASSKTFSPRTEFWNSSIRICPFIQRGQLNFPNDLLYEISFPCHRIETLILLQASPIISIFSRFYEVVQSILQMKCLYFVLNCQY